jgi:hypothetical protein
LGNSLYFGVAKGVDQVRWLEARNRKSTVALSLPQKTLSSGEQSKQRDFFAETQLGEVEVNREKNFRLIELRTRFKS